MKPRLKAALQYVIGLGLGIVLLSLAFRGVSWATLREMIAEVDVRFLAAALSLSLVSHWLRGLRWSLLLEANGHRLSQSHALAAVMFGYMVNNAVPRLGELSRCTILIRTDRIPLLTSAGTVVTERVVDVLVLLGLVAAVFLLEFDRILLLFASDGSGSRLPDPLWLLVPVLLLLFIGLLLYSLRTRWMPHPLAQRLLALLGKLWTAASGVFRLRSPILFVLLSLSIWAAYIGSTWLSMQALPATQNQGLYLALVITAMGGIGMALPSPGGIGSFHSAITYTFIMFGLPQASGNALALLLHTPQLLSTTVVGGLSYFYLVMRSRRSAPSDKAHID